MIQKNFGFAHTKKAFHSDIMTILLISENLKKRWNCQKVYSAFVSLFVASVCVLAVAAALIWIFWSFKHVLPRWIKLLFGNMCVCFLPIANYSSFQRRKMHFDAIKIHSFFFNRPHWFSFRQNILYVKFACESNDV